MLPILTLSRNEVAALLPPIDVQLDLVETTYIELANGQIEAPPKPGIHPRSDSPTDGPALALQPSTPTLNQGHSSARSSRRAIAEGVLS